MAASKILARVTTVTADNTISLRAGAPSFFRLPVNISLWASKNVSQFGTVDTATVDDRFQMNG